MRPEEVGCGVGRALMDGVLDLLRDADLDEAVLWVLGGNQRAIRFYSAAGWSADGAVKNDQIGGTDVTEARYRRTLR